MPRGGYGEADPEIEAAVDRALDAAGIAVTRVPGWDADATTSAIGVIIDAEGFRSNAYLMPYLRQLSPHVRRNIERGARLTRADRLAAERTKAAVRDLFSALLADFPVLVFPTLLGQPPLLGEHGFSLTALTAPVNLAGLPALALPVPAPERHRSASMQVIGSDRGAGSSPSAARSSRPPSAPEFGPVEAGVELTSEVPGSFPGGHTPVGAGQSDRLPVQTPVIGVRRPLLRLPVTLDVIPTLMRLPHREHRVRRLVPKRSRQKTTNFVRSARTWSDSIAALLSGSASALWMR